MLLLKAVTFPSGVAEGQCSPASVNLETFFSLIYSSQAARDRGSLSLEGSPGSDGDVVGKLSSVEAPGGLQGDACQSDSFLSTRFCGEQRMNHKKRA
jgi:hypothetical protein